MKGYKAFESGLTCRGFKFSTDNTHAFDGEPILCEQGFHFCTTLEDVVKYYHWPNMRVFEIEATGVITEAKVDCSKRACSEITLVKEISLDEVMLSITKSEPACWWALDIGNKDIMIDKINESKWAYFWARHIGNKDIMISIVTESIWAYEWARWIGNQDIMKPRVTEPFWIERWNDIFPDDEIK